MGVRMFWADIIVCERLIELCTKELLEFYHVDLLTQHLSKADLCGSSCMVMRVRGLISPENIRNGYAVLGFGDQDQPRP